MSHVRSSIEELWQRLPHKHPIKGGEFLMEPADAIVAHEADVDLGDGQRFRLGATEASSRPPFEWHYEVTSELGESDYLKHYLVRDHDVVLAQRRVLTPLDEAEARIVLGDLKSVQNWLDAQAP